MASRRTLARRVVETVRQYWYLGCTSFGGPGVHVVILRQRFVDTLKWVDSKTFADLFALSNALPGPGSTQLAFSIATVRNGAVSGLIAFLLWSLPGAIGMASLGAGVRQFPERIPPIVLALLTGLNAAAVGLIALAAFQLSSTCVTDPVTRLIVLASASVGVCIHAPWVYPVLIAAGGVTTLVMDYRQRILARICARRIRYPQASSDIQLQSLERPPSHPSPAVTARSEHPLRRRSQTSGDDINALATTDGASSESPLIVLDKRIAALTGLLFIMLLVIPLAVRNSFDKPPVELDFFSNMVVAGVIIFGGGPVVVPLLRGYTVDNGWVDSREFLLGFAILQAFPGPNFNFAAYLGVLVVHDNPALGAFLGWVGIFAPGLLLKLALLPAYSSWRRLDIVKSVLRGLNSAASGLVWTAVWQLFLVGYIYTPASGVPTSTTRAASASGPLTADPFWGVVAASAFVATQWFRAPPAVTVIGGALAGLCWFGVVGPRGTERQQLVWK